MAFVFMSLVIVSTAYWEMVDGLLLSTFFNLRRRSSTNLTRNLVLPDTLPVALQTPLSP